MLVCLHICPFTNYYYPEIAWKTVEILQHFKVEQVFVPNEKVSIGRIEFEAGNFNTSKEKLSKFVEIFSDKYSIVLSHNTRDVVHYRTQYSSILRNTTAAPKAVFFEDKFAEVTEFLIKFSDKIYANQQSNIGLVLNYDGGIKSGINEKTKKLLENHEFDFTTWYLPCVYSNSYELDSLKMTQFLNTISQKNIDLVFNDVEAMFFVESYAKAMNLDWSCKHVVQLFDIKREL